MTTLLLITNLISASPALQAPSAIWTQDEQVQTTEMAPLQQTVTE